MKLFLDTAKVEDVEQRISTDLIAGITTNPTLIKKSGKFPDDVYREFNKLGITDISMEVVGESSEELFERAIHLTKEFGDIATIKLPCTVDGLKACKRLANLNIRVNVTLVFSVSQAILAALAGATYVSPFIGRIDDNSFDGLDLIKGISKVYKNNYAKTYILAASIRDVHSVSKAFEYGADICTIPPSVFDKMYNHVLTSSGLCQFNEDALNFGKNL